MLFANGTVYNLRTKGKGVSSSPCQFLLPPPPKKKVICQTDRLDLLIKTALVIRLHRGFATAP